MSNLPFIEVVKTYDDGTSLVDVRGKVEVAENFSDYLIDDVTIVSEDGKSKGYIAGIDAKIEFLDHDEKIVSFRALTYPNSEVVILLPYLNKKSFLL